MPARSPGERDTTTARIEDRRRPDDRRTGRRTSSPRHHSVRVRTVQNSATAQDGAGALTSWWSGAARCVWRASTLADQQRGLLRPTRRRSAARPGRRRRRTSLACLAAELTNVGAVGKLRHDLLLAGPAFRARANTVCCPARSEHDQQRRTSPCRGPGGSPHRCRAYSRAATPSILAGLAGGGGTTISAMPSRRGPGQQPASRGRPRPPPSLHHRHVLRSGDHRAGPDQQQGHEQVDLEAVRRRRSTSRGTSGAPLVLPASGTSNCSRWITKSSPSPS